MAGWGRFEEAEARNQELETGREKGRRGGGVAAFLIFGQSRRGTPNDGGMGIRCGTKIWAEPKLIHTIFGGIGKDSGRGGPPMAQMTAVLVSRPSAPFEVVTREVPAPGPNQVRIAVQACGVCHSDMFVKEGHWPGLQYPRITGHEVAGVIDEVGPGVTAWRRGQRVGVGWDGGHCGQCASG